MKINLISLFKTTGFLSKLPSSAVTFALFCSGSIFAASSLPLFTAVSPSLFLVNGFWSETAPKFISPSLSGDDLICGGGVYNKPIKVKKKKIQTFRSENNNLKPEESERKEEKINRIKNCLPLSGEGEKKRELKIWTVQFSCHFSLQLSPIFLSLSPFPRLPNKARKPESIK